MTGSDAKIAVIIGAGPAGLTAASELIGRTDIVPVVVEASDMVGGLSRTVNYKGNRMDIGGHRFFAKSERVKQWWLHRLPLAQPGSDLDPETLDRVMLVRSRRSRIYFGGKFFDYPLSLNMDTLGKLGLARTMKIGLSYLWASLTSSSHPRNLEEFLIGRFGRELYATFFKPYTEKVWGRSCAQISPEWGQQRIKGLSIGKAISHFLRSTLRLSKNRDDAKHVETSLISQFWYPKYGPGQMWETVADEVERGGGTVRLNHRVQKLHIEGDRIVGVDVVDVPTGRVSSIEADYVFSSMPVKELISGLDNDVPENVQAVASGLIYRDFITVGLLVRKLKTEQGARSVRDNWIYIQDPDIRMGRLQVFNNWSPYMVADPDTVWLGLEYFCDVSDDLWNLSDEGVIELAKRELAHIGMVEAADVLDGTVIRMEKAYPAYFGMYDRFDEVRTFTDRFANLFLIGRNGMHRYNNQDHSMLTAMIAVDNITAGRTDKGNIWQVNTEMEYHEQSE